MAGEVGKEPLREERKSVGGEERVGGSILFNSATLCKHPFVTGTMLRSGQKKLHNEKCKGVLPSTFPIIVMSYCAEWNGGTNAEREEGTMFLQGGILMKVS